MKRYAIALLLSVLLCGCNAAKQAGTTTPAPTSATLTGTWTFVFTDTNGYQSTVTSIFTGPSTSQSTPPMIAANSGSVTQTGDRDFVFDGASDEIQIEAAGDTTTLANGEAIGLNASANNTGSDTGNIFDTSSASSGPGATSGVYANGVITGTWSYCLARNDSYPCPATPITFVGTPVQR